MEVGEVRGGDFHNNVSQTFVLGFGTLFTLGKGGFSSSRIASAVEEAGG